MADEQLVPDYKIAVDGSRIPNEARLAVTSITVDLAVDTADLFAIRVRNKNAQWTDDGLWQEGKSVQVDLGYEGQTQKVIEGEITGWKVSYPRSGPSTLLVIGHDKYHRLRREKKSRSFLEMTDSDIASQVARDLGLQPKVDSTKTVHPYVFQSNQTDIDFLFERAQRIGYEVDVVGNELRFVEPTHDESKVVQLEYGENCLYFQPYASTHDQFTEVEVRGWNPKEKKEIVGTSSLGDVSSKMGGQTLGPQASRDAFEDQTTVIARCPVASKEEADAMALAMMREIALGYTTGKGASHGRPEIQAASVVELAGCGEAYDGPYYVRRAIHTFHPSGYTTTFHVRRTALEAPTGPPPQWEESSPAQQQQQQAAPAEPAKALTSPRWSRPEVPSGQPVVMSARVEGIDPGTAGSFKVYRKSGSPPELLETKDSQVDEHGSMEATFDYSYEEGREIQPADFFFKASCQGKEVTSDVLKVRDTIELHYTYADTDVPLSGARYVLELPDGEEMEGSLDGDGKATIEDVSPGKCKIRFPEYEEEEEEESEDEEGSTGDSTASTASPAGGEPASSSGAAATEDVDDDASGDDAEDEEEEEEPEKGRLVVKVLDGRGEPLAEADGSAGGKSGRTADDGTFEVGEVKAGSHDVEVSKEGYRAKDDGGQSVEVPEGETKEVEATLEKIPVLTILEVQDDDGGSVKDGAKDLDAKLRAPVTIRYEVEADAEVDLKAGIVAPSDGPAADWYAERGGGDSLDAPVVELKDVKGEPGEHETTWDGRDTCSGDERLLLAGSFTLRLEVPDDEDVEPAETKLEIARPRAFSFGSEYPDKYPAGVRKFASEASGRTSKVSSLDDGSGFRTETVDDVDKGEALEMTRKKAALFLWCGHADANRIAFCKNKVQTLISRGDLGKLDGDALKDLGLVVLDGCETGKGIHESFVDRGADLAFGWEAKVTGRRANPFVDAFLDALQEGDTVDEALEAGEGAWSKKNLKPYKYVVATGGVDTGSWKLVPARHGSA